MNTAAGPIGTVLLAAGGSTRMGRPKQLLPYDGKSLLRRAVETALTLPASPLIVVLGAHAEQIRPELDGLPVISAYNPDWQDGMGGSLRAGLEALLSAHPDAAAVLFMLCDQPLLTATTLHVLRTAYQAGRSVIAASEYGGVLGVPALFDRRLFPDIQCLKGGGGARELIQRHREQTVGVPFPEGIIDIDTPADYARTLAEMTT